MKRIIAITLTAAVLCLLLTVPCFAGDGVDAVMEWGILIGTLMAVWRVMRCNPFSAGGNDPVPARREVWEKIRRIFCKRFD